MILTLCIVVMNFYFNLSVCFETFDPRHWVFKRPGQTVEGGTDDDLVGWCVNNCRGRYFVEINKGRGFSRDIVRFSRMNDVVLLKLFHPEYRFR